MPKPSNLITKPYLKELDIEVPLIMERKPHDISPWPSVIPQVITPTIPHTKNKVKTIRYIYASTIQSKNIKTIPNLHRLIQDTRRSRTRHNYPWRRNTNETLKPLDSFLMRGVRYTTGNRVHTKNRRIEIWHPIWFEKRIRSWIWSENTANPIIQEIIEACTRRKTMNNTESIFMWVLSYSCIEENTKVDCRYSQTSR